MKRREFIIVVVAKPTTGRRAQSITYHLSVDMLSSPIM
jgi:hypothetical protein